MLTTWKRFGVIENSRWPSRERCRLRVPVPLIVAVVALVAVSMTATEVVPWLAM